MAAAGILVLHFSPRQIREDRAEVIGSLRSALLTRRGQSLPGITTLPVLQ
jgi:hypothetical protein